MSEIQGKEGTVAVLGLILAAIGIAVGLAQLKGEEQVRTLVLAVAGILFLILFVVLRQSHHKHAALCVLALSVILTLGAVVNIGLIGTERNVAENDQSAPATGESSTPSRNSLPALETLAPTTAVTQTQGPETTMEPGVSDPLDSDPPESSISSTKRYVLKIRKAREFDNGKLTVTFREYSAEQAEIVSVTKKSDCRSFISAGGVIVIQGEGEDWYKLLLLSVEADFSDTDKASLRVEKFVGPTAPAGNLC